MKKKNYNSVSYPHERRAQPRTDNHYKYHPPSYRRTPIASSRNHRRSPSGSYRNQSLNSRGNESRIKIKPRYENTRSRITAKQKIFMSAFILIITTLGVYIYFSSISQGGEEIIVSDKKVATFYYGWYSNSTDYSQTTPIEVVDDTQWRHWGQNPQTNLEATSRWTPTQGWFDSADPQVIETHIRQAEWAGIDAFIVSFMGTERFSFENFKTMLRVAKLINSKMKFTIYLETKRYSELSNPEAFDLLTSELESIHDFYLDKNQEDYIWFHDGKPVLFNWITHFIDEEVWINSLDYMINMGKSFFLNAWRPSDSPNLNAYFQGAHLYGVHGPLVKNNYHQTFLKIKTRCNQFNQLFCASVGPGYDDTYVRPEANKTILERLDGKTYQQCWDYALALDPEWITITSWNEWHEGSEIEPSVENGDLALRQTKDFIKRFKSMDLQPKALIFHSDGNDIQKNLMLNTIWIALIELFIISIRF